MTGPRSAAWMLDVIAHWAERRWLRPLDVALARFVSSVAPASDGPTLLAIALTAHLEGLGHTCLVLADLFGADGPDLAWPDDARDALRHVLHDLPRDEPAWHAAFATSAAVRVVATHPGGNQPFVVDHGRLYLRRYWQHEQRIAEAVGTRAARSLEVEEATARHWIDRLFERRDGTGPDWQKIACATALRGRITIVTGGPGTGKTFTAVRLLATLMAMQPAGLRIALAAPTGKAAARLRQSVAAALEPLVARVGAVSGDGTFLRDAFGRIAPARTLHALLGMRRGSRRFRHDAMHPLDVDVLLVDEASMVHVEMMDALLAALPATARLVLVGDEDQLASVEAGAVLGELCAHRTDRMDAETARYLLATTGEAVASAAGPALTQRIVRLRRSERFGGALDALARAVRGGQVDEAGALLRQAGDGDIVWRHPVVPADVVEQAVGGYAYFAAAVAGRPDSLLVEDHDAWVATVLAAFERFRVLTPVRAGPWGVEGLNVAIARRLGDTGATPVIATRNDADLGIFNGDVGVVLPASPTDVRLRAWFVDGIGGGPGVRSISLARLTDVETAFAITVHRAQGSEFECVALVVPPEAPRALTRELLYTGITRARRSLTILSADEGSWKAGIARATRRSSGLAAMLRAAESEIQDEGPAART